MTTQRKGQMTFEEMNGLSLKLNNLTNDNAVAKREVVTQAYYDALVVAGTTVSTTEYIIVG